MSQLRGPDGAGGGLLPPHDRHLLAVLDGRVASLDPDEFLAVLLCRARSDRSACLS